MVTIAGPLDVRARRFANPGFGDDLTISPSSALQEELPKFRHVPRVQLEVAPAMIVAVGIGGPHDVVDAERREQLAAGEGQSVGASSLRENGGQEVAVAAAVRPPCTGLSDHWQVEHEPRPIGAAAHLEQSSFPRLEAAVPAGLHGEKMFEGEFSLSRVEICSNAPLQHAHHGLLHVR